MLIVAVVMEKGGVGKTTIALNLAVAAVQDGRTTAIIDIDPQATVSNWTDRRSHEKPWVVPTPAARITAAIEQAKTQGVDFIVIDTPPAFRQGFGSKRPAGPTSSWFQSSPGLARNVQTVSEVRHLYTFTMQLTNPRQAPSTRPGSSHISAGRFRPS